MTYSINGLYSEVAATLSSCCQRTDEQFCSVSVDKRDALTNTSYRWRYIQDIRTGELYQDESQWVIAEKCALLCVVTPLYTAGSLGWHLCQIAYSVMRVVLSIFQAGFHVACGNLSEAGDVIDAACASCVHVCKEQCADILAAPLFGLSIITAAAFGIFKPLQGRKIIALLDKAWHKGASYKEDMRYRNGPSDKLFLAYCFQVRGNVSDDAISVIDRAPLDCSC